MADVNGEGASDLNADGTEKVKKKGLSGKVLVLFILLPLLLVGGGVGGAFVAGVFDGEAPDEEVVEEEEPKAPEVVVFYDLPEMLVNLDTNGAGNSFLKISVSLELNDQLALPELEKLMPRVMDNFQVYLRQLRAEDLKGAGGIYRLKEELLYRINSSVKPIQVKDVLFKEMLVQ